MTMSLDFETELLKSTKEMLIFLIGKDNHVNWINAGKINTENFNEAAKAIADALREAATKIR